MRLRGFLAAVVIACCASRFFIVVAARDRLVNPAPALQWAALVGAGTFISQGDCGHRMLLPECDSAVVGAAVRKFLDEK